MILCDIFTIAPNHNSSSKNLGDLYSPKQLRNVQSILNIALINLFLRLHLIHHNELSRFPTATTIDSRKGRMMMLSILSSILLLMFLS